MLSFSSPGPGASQATLGTVSGSQGPPKALWAVTWPGWLVLTLVLPHNPALEMVHAAEILREIDALNAF